MRERLLFLALIKPIAISWTSEKYISFYVDPLTLSRVYAYKAFKKCLPGEYLISSISLYYRIKAKCKNCPSANQKLETDS